MTGAVSSHNGLQALSRPGAAFRVAAIMYLCLVHFMVRPGEPGH